MGTDGRFVKRNYYFGKSTSRKWCVGFRRCVDTVLTGQQNLRSRQAQHSAEHSRGFQTPRTFQIFLFLLRRHRIHCWDLFFRWTTVRLFEANKAPLLVLKSISSYLKPTKRQDNPSLRLLGRSALCLCLCFVKTSCCAAVGTCVVET